MTEEVATAEGTAQVAEWTDGLGDDLKGYVENKGWKAPTDLLASYQNLEKLRGVPEERLLRLPDDPGKAGAMDPIYDKLGRPESPDKYTRAVGEEFNDDVFKAISATAHKYGVTDTAFKALQEDMTKLSASVVEAQEEQAATRFDEWKGKNPDGFTNAARVMATVGVGEEQLAGILSGDKASLYDFLAKVGSRSAEGAVIDGEQPRGEFGMSPAAAKQKIADLMADKEFMKQYTSPSQKVRQPAIDRLMKLHEAAAKEK